MKAPTITVVVAAYNAERLIPTTLESILAQTRPAQEIVVVDDGSTDGTPGVLERFGKEIRVVRQANQGHPGAYNRGFAEAGGDYVARCDADDVWEPAKLERQAAAVAERPEIDVAFCAARFFGLVEGPYAPHPGEGLLDRSEFADRLFRANLVCSSSTLIRRTLYRRLGPFVERLPCEDYDYWMRALAAGAVFHYDPTALVRYRRHEQQVTHSLLRMQRATYMVHTWHRDLCEDRSLVEQVLARDLFRIGRSLVEADRVGEARAGEAYAGEAYAGEAYAGEAYAGEARAAFVASLRHRPTPRALGWALILSMPGSRRQRLIDALVGLRRALAARFGAATG